MTIMYQVLQQNVFQKSSMTHLLDKSSLNSSHDIVSLQLQYKIRKSWLVKLSPKQPSNPAPQYCNSPTRPVISNYYSL